MFPQLPTAVWISVEITYTSLEQSESFTLRGALGHFLGGYVPPGTPNWHPVLEKISPKIDTPF